MTMAESTVLFNALPDSTQQYFYGIAAKSDAGHTAVEFFNTEIPDVLKSDPAGIEILLDGGTVTVPVDTFERGRASSGTDTVEFEMPDRDMSRIESGANGGDYTPDNVILESASDNRARGAADMTDAEFDSVSDTLAGDAEIIANRVADTGDIVIADVATAGESAGDVFGTVLESVLPVTMGAKCAHTVWQSTDHMDDGERVATTALAAGSGVLATVVVMSNPITATIAAGYAGWKLFGAATKLADKYL